MSEKEREREREKTTWQHVAIETIHVVSTSNVFMDYPFSVSQLNREMLSLMVQLWLHVDGNFLYIVLLTPLGLAQRCLFSSRGLP